MPGRSGTGSFPPLTSLPALYRVGGLFPKPRHAPQRLRLHLSLIVLSYLLHSLLQQTMQREEFQVQKNSFQIWKNSDQEAPLIATSDAVMKEMSAALRDIAGARCADDSIEFLIVRAWRRLPRDLFSHSKVRKLWYGTASLVRAEHADEIRKARKAALRLKIAAQKEEIEQMQRTLDEWS